MVHEKSAPISTEVICKENERFVLFSEPRFTVYGEFKGEHLFLHCSPIKSWSRSCYIACLEAMNIIRDEALKQGIEHLFVVIRMSKLKFVSMLGFEPIEVYTDQDNNPLVLCVQHSERGLDVSR